MNRFHDNRWEQLRAVEADLLCPPPVDPFQRFPIGWLRASDLSANDWNRISRHEWTPSSPPREPSPDRRAIRRTPPPRVNHLALMRLPERRPFRQVNGAIARRPTENQARQQNPEVSNPVAENIQNGARRRPLSPTQLPGVRAIPKDYNRYFRGLLSPGEYFAKSQTRYLGPFDEMPREGTLPSNDEYIILQRMGRLPESGKSIFRQVGSLST